MAGLLKTAAGRVREGMYDMLVDMRWRGVVSEIMKRSKPESEMDAGSLQSDSGSASQFVLPSLSQKWITFKG